MTEPRLASGFWIAAKIRQIQNAGGFASILVKGHNEAGTINLFLRGRDGFTNFAVPVINSMGASERQFEWRDGRFTDLEISALIERELKFDRDQWFVECECSEEIFLATFDIISN